EGVMLPAGKLAVYDKLKANDPQFKVLKGYDQSYKKAYGVEASTFGGYAYDAFQLITEAMKKGGNTPAGIRAAIEQQRKLVGVSGIFAMSEKDHNGLGLSDFVMVRISRGDWVIAH
ncbi:MAG TPA: ABC transporter substrate-binding protein, partial [Geobacteraceae bacterium]